MWRTFEQRADFVPDGDTTAALVLAKSKLQVKQRQSSQTIHDEIRNEESSCVHRNKVNIQFCVQVNTAVCVIGTLCNKLNILCSWYVLNWILCSWFLSKLGVSLTHRINVKTVPNSCYTPAGDYEIKLEEDTGLDSPGGTRCPCLFGRFRSFNISRRKPKATEARAYRSELFGRFRSFSISRRKPKAFAESIKPKAYIRDNVQKNYFSRLNLKPKFICTNILCRIKFTEVNRSFLE